MSRDELRNMCSPVLLEQVRITALGKEHQCNPLHYNNAQKKSQWIPRDPDREFRLFDLADQSNWTDGTADYWAVDIANQDPLPLGLDKTRAVRCRIARFVRDARTCPWHGYPITLTRDGEFFPKAVLECWTNHQLLDRGWLKKIRQRRV